VKHYIIAHYHLSLALLLLLLLLLLLCLPQACWCALHPGG
jgi:hypothetical protein